MRAVVLGIGNTILTDEAAGVRVFRTANGVPLLVQRHPGAIAYLGWFVRGGATDESAPECGLTSLMARCALKGTERRSAERLAEDAEFLGGVMSSGSNADGFHWTMSVPVRRLDEAAELLADVVQRPAFGDAAFEAERTVALANIASLRDDMYRRPMQLAMQCAWGGHAYGRSLLGTETTLAAFDAATLRRWHTAQAVDATGVLVCVADADPDDIASLAARYFGGLAPAPGRAVAAPAWPATFAERSESRDKAQSALAMLFPGAARGDDARFDAAMLAGVASGLGGRFFDELRDRRSLAYTVMAMPLVRHQAGAFGAYIAMSPEKEQAAREGLLAEFARLCDDDVTDAELTQAKRYALGTWAIRRESGGAVMGDIADAWLFGRDLGELVDYPERIRGITAREMRNAARRWFDPARRVEGLVRGRGG